MSKIRYDDLKIEGLKEILREVSTCCKELSIDCFLIGAVAKNIWLKSGENETEGTKDIDFGIYIPEEKDFDRLREMLIEKYNYKQNEENAFCLITADGQQIDLLPFGNIENDGTIRVMGKGLVEINIEGFEECYKSGLKQIEIEGDKYYYCSIPAIVILKLIAFDDRPEKRIKDVKDINRVCDHYAEIETDNIWSNHADLYDNELEHDEVSLIALGREINKIVAKNIPLKKRIVNILIGAIENESNFLTHMIEDSEQETLSEKRKKINCY